MNLVIDNAVEVKQKTKENPEETRRPLGTLQPIDTLHATRNGIWWSWMDKEG